MNKIFLTAVVAAGLFGSSFAQENDEFANLTVWLQKYYCQQYNVQYLTPNDQGYDEAKWNKTGMFSIPVSAWTLQSEMWNKIRQEYPMPADLQATVTALENQKNAKYQALAQKYGYSSMEELWNHVKGDNLDVNKISQEQQVIDDAWNIEYSAVYSPYQAEFSKRYQAAVIEAINRIQENAQAMNPKE